MKCPNDQATLVMSERSGIEIDYCPECRGVWLDRGELDKIIERAGSDSGAAQPAPQQQYGQPAYGQQPQYGQPQYGQQQYGGQSRDDGFRYDDHRGNSGYGRKKKDNWLGELFG